MAPLNQWKPVQIDGIAFNNNLDGLIGIEECSDYDLSSILRGKKAKKRITADAIVGVVPKKKKKVNKTSRQVEAKCKIENNPISPSRSGCSDGEFLSEHESGHSNLEDVKPWGAYGLPTSLLEALASLKFTEPTQIQSLTLPAAIMGKRDILGAAETGSGKTLAFGLPILFGILKSLEQFKDDPDGGKQLQDDLDLEESPVQVNKDGLGCVRIINNLSEKEVDGEAKPLYALILTPTRELAVQIKNHLAALARFTPIKIALVVGGMSIEKQERILSKAPEIVVGTPGRLWELIQQGNSHLSRVNDIKFLAIDETDRMIERGHFQELHDILEKVNADEERRKRRQNFVFSATLTLVHELPRHLATKKKLLRGRVGDMTAEQKLMKIIELLGITNPKCVDITKGKGTSGTLTECRITCSINEKDYYLYYFLQKHSGRTLVFCNSIGCVKRLSTIMGLLDCHPLPLHASMQQRQRLKNLDRFKESEHGLLIATDVAARGLDIPCVEHVIHYQTPRTSEGYVHRSGRTARATRHGITVLLVEPSELQSYLRLCRTLGKKEDIPSFPVQGNLLDAVKSRVNAARELDKLELQLKKTNSQAGWMQKVADEMDIVLDDDLSHNYDKAEAKQLKRAAELKRKELSLMLARPLFPKGFSGRYPLSNSEELFGQGEQKTAVEVMKSALEDKSKVQFKKPRFLFKPKVKKASEGLSSKVKVQVKNVFNRKSKRKDRKKKVRVS